METAWTDVGSRQADGASPNSSAAAAAGWQCGPRQHASDKELVDHTNVVTDQDLFIVVENDEQSAEVIVNPNGNIGMIRMVSLSIFWSGSGSYFYSYFYSYSYTTVNILFLRDPKYEYKYIYDHSWAQLT